MLKTENGLIFCQLCDSGEKELNVVTFCSKPIAICNECLKKRQNEQETLTTHDKNLYD